MPTSAEHLIDSLLQKNAKHVFGLPGDYILPFIDKIYKSKLEFVPTTSELSAGIAADAYARVNGIGVACVTYCVGGFRMLDAIAGAYAERSPVVVISGSPGIKERNSKTLLHHMVGHFECQHEMYENITCANTVLRDPNTAGYEIERVLTAVMHHKQPGYIELPRDIADKSIRYDVYTGGTPVEQPSDERSLAEVVAEVTGWINSAKQPVIWAGVEVSRWGFGKALTKFAEHANIPIATTILGKSVINERHPLSLGVYCTSTANAELRDIMESSDCIIMLGVMQTDVNFGFMPLKYQKRNIVLATSSSMQVRSHSYQDVNFQDFAEALFKSRIDKKASSRTIPKKEVRFAVASAKITTKRVFDKVNSILTDKIAVIADVGDALFGSLDMTVHDSHTFLSDAFYSSMGWSVPAALGVQTARPEMRPIVLIGDGAFQMVGMEFSTLVRRKLNAIVIVLNNGGYGTERLILDGAFNDLQNWSFEKVPLIVGGGLGFKVTTEQELDEAMTQALACDQPSIINVILDPKDYTDGLKNMFRKKG